MPSVDPFVNNPPDMVAVTDTSYNETFDTFKRREEKDSDDESFHLPLDDDETEQNLKNGNGVETEDDILNKFHSTSPEPNDAHVEEERLLNDDEEENKTSTNNEDVFKTNSESKLSSCDSSDLVNKEVNDTEKSKINESEHLNGDPIDSATNGSNESVTEESESTAANKEKEHPTNVDCEMEEDNLPLDDKENENNTNVDCEMEEDDIPLAKISQVNSSDQDLEKSVENPSEEMNVDNEETKKEITKTSESENISASAKEDQPKNDALQKNNTLENNKNKLDKCENSNDSTKNQSEDSNSKNGLDKCENSNDSTKDQNEDSEDLFDISIIRDAMEDNAENAAQQQAEQNQLQNEESEDCDDRTSEKTDNNEEDGNTSDKVDNIEEEMDIDSEDDVKKQDGDSEHLKNDDVVIEESNLKDDCDSAKTTSNSNSGAVVKDTLSDVNKTDKVKNNDSKYSKLDEITGEMVASEKQDNSAEKTVNGGDALMDIDSNGEPEKRKSLKRALSDEAELGAAKKSKTECDSESGVKEAEKVKDEPLKTLLSLPEYMKNKKANKRLTMNDLEEFCLQKMCEAILHKSDVGEVYHQLKMHEQLVESMRKEIQQLTKQARDLEIVNKKLMNDLKQQNTTQKPLAPLKITRSVGLQVKFTPTLETNARRKSGGQATPQKVQVQASASNRGPRNIPNNTTTSPANRQVNIPQKVQQTVPKPNTPILTDALQNRRSVNDTTNRTIPQAIRPKPPESKTPSASVIDLTDEDEKKDNKNKNNTKVATPQKSISLPLRTAPVRVSTSQGIRITTSQGKGTPISSVVTTSTPQLMYVVQSSASSPQLGQKAVLVNLTPNGILTNAINGSAVSVIPKQTNTVQLKQVPTLKTIPTNQKLVKLVNKHPAPLPAPPVVRVNTEKSLKPIPPKPHLTIKKTDTGIILQWRMPYELDMYETIASYQLYAYQETSATPSTDMWRKVGDVKALALPMACTLTQFADKNKYYFAVRPVDIHKRIGVFSDPEEISL